MTSLSHHPITSTSSFTIEVMDTNLAVKGIVRRRRNMSRNLVFFDLEQLHEQSDIESTDTDSCEKHDMLKSTQRFSERGATFVQLVCEWSDEVPKVIVVGMLVEARGGWDSKGRFNVSPQLLSVVGDLRGDSPWDNANTAKSFRAQHHPLLPSKDWSDRATQKKLEKFEKKRLAEELYARTQKSSTLSGADGELEVGEEQQAHGLADKSKHNLVFVQWLVATFGLDRLGGGVCDIAGGRGLVSLELALTHGVPAVLIEPKPLRINSSFRKRIKKWQRRRLGDGATDSQLGTSVCSGVSEETFPSPQPVLHLQEEFHWPGKGDEEVMAAVSRANTTLLAMHPDQATGAVLAAALQLNTPFALVPCCVFSRLYPSRLTPAGTTVSTYEELCDWIQCQSPDICRATLPFHGRNVVLYRL